MENIGYMSVVHVQVQLEKKELPLANIVLIPLLLVVAYNMSYGNIILPLTWFYGNY